MPCMESCTITGVRAVHSIVICSFPSAALPRCQCWLAAAGSSRRSQATMPERVAWSPRRIRGVFQPHPAQARRTARAERDAPGRQRRHQAAHRLIHPGAARPGLMAGEPEGEPGPCAAPPPARTGSRRRRRRCRGRWPPRRGGPGPLRVDRVIDLDQGRITVLGAGHDVAEQAAGCRTGRWRCWRWKPRTQRTGDGRAGDQQLVLAVPLDGHAGYRARRASPRRAAGRSRPARRSPR